MYNVYDGEIHVEIDKDKTIIVKDNSPFYGELKNLIGVHKEAHDMIKAFDMDSADYTIDDWMYIKNNSFDVAKRINTLIENKARVFEVLRVNNIQKLVEINRNINNDIFRSDFSRNEYITQHLSTKLKNLTEFAKSKNPVITLNLLGEVNEELEKLENSEAEFKERLQIEPLETIEDVTRKVLPRYGLSESSPFYPLAKNSLESNIACADTARTVQYVGNEHDRIIAEKLEEIREKNNRALLDLSNATGYYGSVNGVNASPVHYSTAFERVPRPENTMSQWQQANRNINNGNMAGAIKTIDSLAEDSRRAQGIGRAVREIAQKDTGRREEVPQRRYRSSKSTNEMKEKKKKNKVKIICCGVAATVLGITVAVSTLPSKNVYVNGINKGWTLGLIDKDTTYQRALDGYVVVDLEQTNQVEVTATEQPTPVQQPIEVQTPQPQVQTPQPQVQGVQEVETSNVGTKTEEIDTKSEVDNSDTTTENPMVRKSFASSVDLMSDEEVSFFAEIIRKGNKRVPGSYLEAFGLGLGAQHLSEREFLRKAFSEIDTKISSVESRNDTGQLAYHMPYIMMGVAQMEVAEAMQATGVNISADDVKIWGKCDSNTCRNANYDIFYMKNGKKKTVAQKSHMKRTGFGRGVEAAVSLERITELIGAFDWSDFRAEMTQECYEVSLDYLSGEKNLRKFTKTPRGFEEINGERPTDGVKNEDIENR